MQGFQPLFAGNAVQHMLAQRMIVGEFRVFEILLGRVMHANGLHFLTETLPAGLLGHIASGLRISEAMAGQLVTAYALGAVIGAPGLATKFVDAKSVKMSGPGVGILMILVNLTS